MPDAAAMTPHQAEEALFAEHLAVRPVLPVRFQPGGPEPRRLPTAAERLLQRLAQIEDGQSVEDPEETGPQDLALARIEARLQLLAEQVAAMARQHEPERPEQALHWSARGLSMTVDAAVSPGDTGVVEIEVADWLPQPLRLPCRVLACADDAGGTRAWLAFDPVTEGLDAALQRHLFRLHRREVAEARRQR